MRAFGYRLTVTSNYGQTAELRNDGSSPFGAAGRSFFVRGRLAEASDT